MQQPMIFTLATKLVLPRPVKNEKNAVSMQVSPAQGAMPVKYSIS